MRFGLSGARAAPRPQVRGFEKENVLRSLLWIRSAVVICCCLLALPAFAQSDRGTITGTVFDQATAVVPGAKVVATHSATGTVYHTITTATGIYALASLPAGLYDISVEMQGFKKVTQTGAQVQVAQVLRVDVTLQVGATSESVTVTAEAPMLRTENSEQSVNVSGSRFNALPLNFGGGGGSTGSIRNWLSFVILAPGVSGPNERAGNTGPERSAVNGAPAGAFKIYLEGQDVTSSNDTVWTSTVAAASVEAIGEFSMQTSNFSAEFGQVLGGVFNFTTKSGTNQIHGSAYEYFTNEALDARRHFTGIKPVSRKHDFGFSAGGPVYIPKLYDGRNKTFFFFNLEYFRVKTRSSANFINVPTDAYRSGDFSRALTGRTLTDSAGRAYLENAIYDPRSEATVNGLVTRTMFPRNVIPGSLRDPVALKIQDLIPRPLNSELVQNYQPDTSNHKYQTLPSVKIDHNLSDTTRLSGYWSVQKTDQITGTDGLPAPITSRRDQKIYGHTTRLNVDKAFTPRLLLHLGAGYLRFHNPDSSPPEVLRYDAAGGIGFTGSATGVGFPYINALNSNVGGFSNQMGPSTAGLYYNDKLTGVANMTYVRGSHTYKLGGEFKQEVWADQNFYQSQGHFGFDRAQTGQPYLFTTTVGGGSIGFPYASFLLGLPQNATVTAPRTLQWRKKAWSLYLQDDWKITRKLTLGMGLRWDLAGQGHEQHWRTSQIGVSTPNPSAGNLPGGIVYEGFGQGRCNCSFVKTYPYAVGPRLGLAYQINDRTVVRAGWGISYSALSNWWYITGGSSTLGVGFNSLTWASPNYGDAAVQLGNGLRYNRADLDIASFDPGIVPVRGSLNVPPAWGGQINDPNGGRPGRVNQWNLAVQHELARNLSLEVAYVGNRGIWLEANDLIRVNAINPATLSARGLDIRNPADRTLLTSTIGSQLARDRGFTLPYAGYPTGASVAQTLRPFPMYNDNLNVRWAPLGNSWYDSLQVKFSKRYSRGLDMTAAFTWQKELARGTGGNPSAGGGGINNVFNRQIQKSLTGNSQPFIFVTGFNYETPRLGSNRFLRALLGNWTVGGILRYASGSLIGVPGSQNNLGSLIYQATRMNRVSGQSLFLQDPNCKCIDPNKAFVLNPAAWVDAAPGQWGVSAPFYNDYRWQRSVAEQASLGRTFRLRERMAIQVRAEYFNIFNRTFLPNPTSANALATQTRNSLGVPTSGFGYVNATATPGARNGQLVARFEF